MYKENTLSILGNLLQRHQQSAARYREAVALVPEDRQAVQAFLQALAEYREEIAEQLRRVLQNFPSTAIPKGAAGQPLISEEWDNIRDAMLLGNYSRLLKLCYQNEKALSEYYKTCLNQEGVPEDVQALWTEQHQEVVHQMRRAERMATVPRQQ